MSAIVQVQRSGYAGLTLVETLIALTLVAVVLLPVMIGLSQALFATSQSSIVAAATSIARDKIEQIKGEARRANFDFTALASQPRVAADFRPGDSFFEVEVTVETIRADDNQQSGLKKVVVSVYRAGSDSPTATITTYLVPFGT